MHKYIFILMYTAIIYKLGNDEMILLFRVVTKTENI